MNSQEEFENQGVLAKELADKIKAYMLLSETTNVSIAVISGEDKFCFNISCDISSASEIEQASEPSNPEPV